MATVAQAVNFAFLLFMTIATWPHPGGWPVAMIWFLFYVANDHTNHKLLNKYSELTDDIMREWGETIKLLATNKEDHDLGNTAE